MEQLLSTYHSPAKVRLTVQRPAAQATSNLEEAEEEVEDEESLVTNGTEEDDTPSSLFVSTPPRLVNNNIIETCKSVPSAYFDSTI